jgi:hypothetical protein
MRVSSALRLEVVQSVKGMSTTPSAGGVMVQAPGYIADIADAVLSDVLAYSVCGYQSRRPQVNFSGEFPCTKRKIAYYPLLP